MVRPSFLLIPIIIGTSCALEWEKGGAFDNKTHFFPLTAYYGIGILLVRHFFYPQTMCTFRTWWNNGKRNTDTATSL